MHADAAKVVRSAVAAALEPLERRDLLSASHSVHSAPRLPMDQLDFTAGVSAGGTLWVVGTDSDEAVVFSRDGEDVGQYVVNVNGQLAWFSTERVKRIHIETAGGDDSVIFDETYRQTMVPKAV